MLKGQILPKMTAKIQLIQQCIANESHIFRLINNWKYSTTQNVNICIVNY